MSTLSCYKDRQRDCKISKVPTLELSGGSTKDSSDGLFSYYGTLAGEQLCVCKKSSMPIMVMFKLLDTLQSLSYTYVRASKLFVGRSLQKRLGISNVKCVESIESVPKKEMANNSGYVPHEYKALMIKKKWGQTQRVAAVAGLMPDR